MASLPNNYGDVDRAFLQALMCRGSMTLAEATPVLQVLFAAANRSLDDAAVESTMEMLMARIREAIAHLDYDIRRIFHQQTRERVYALVNTTSDVSTQLATLLTADEISFVKRLLDTMFDTYNTERMEVMAVTQQQCLPLGRPPRHRSNLSQTQAQSPTQTQLSMQSQDGADTETADTSQLQDKGITHSEVQQVLTTLVDGGWLEKSRENFYSLSPRALMELRPWLIETYNDPDAEPHEWQRIKLCVACKEIVTYGKRCRELTCPMRLHDICEGRYWRARMNQLCPVCERPWEGHRYVGERAVTLTKLYQARIANRRSNVAAEEAFREGAGMRQEGEEDEREGDEGEGEGQESEGE